MRKKNAGQRRNMKNIVIILIAIVAIILVLFGVTYFGKGNTNSTISLTEANTNQTINATTGNTIKVTLRNPGDGGYQFADPTYDNTILQLQSKTHTSSQTNLSGDFGSDIWTYKVIKAGSTQLQYSIFRPWDTTDRSNVLTVNIVAK